MSLVFISFNNNIEKVKNNFLLVLCLLLTVSCQELEKDRISRLIREWDGREVLFPSSSVFTIQGQDTVKFDFSHSAYKVVMYADSVGCVSCKLQLSKWKSFIKEVESLQNKIGDVSFLIYFNSKVRKELQFILNRDSFVYPVCLDERDEFNNLNHFPSEGAFQTFLLNRNNEIIAVGNPIYNLKINDLYLKFMQGKIPSLKQQCLLTTMELDYTNVNFDVFSKIEKQEQIIKLKNIGKEPLVIQGVSTSCGCTKVEFDKKPVPLGNDAILNIIYEADKSGYFRKTVDVYCNIASSPLQIIVTGEANER